MDAGIALAIPVFFLLIGVELLVGRIQGVRRYRFTDSVTNLSCGIGQQTLDPFLVALQLGVYVTLYERARFFTLPASAGSWVAAFVGADFLYYWFHRASHRVNVIWAAHVVHHQSEEYNLSVALRQSWLQGLFESAFYLPLALAGIAPSTFLGASLAVTLYQFWIHTRVVKTLGPLEWIMNTPSHHRVHHGINPRYIDKNYAGVFIVWDRLFGTFAEEDEEPVYGTVKPLASWNPLWANVEQWVAIARLSRSAPRVVDKVGAWFMPPEWRPRELGGPVTIPPVSRATQVKYKARAGRGVGAYVLVNFVLVLAATSGLLLFRARLSPRLVVAAAALIVMSLVAWGALFEGKRWGKGLEMTRVAGILATAAWWTL